MTYVVTVHVRLPEQDPEMDPLQQFGAGTLIERGFGTVDDIAGPDGAEVDLLEISVALYPGGAFLRTIVAAPTLESAEYVVRAAVRGVLDRSELLEDWQIVQCEVELTPEFALESLDAADGPDAPPDDPADRRARHAGLRAGADGAAEAAAAETVRRKMLALAGALRSFPSELFGVVFYDENDEGADRRSGSAAVRADAKLAAGALVHVTDVFVGQLLDDVEALTAEGTTVAECEARLWHLDALPPRYAPRYDAAFARRFLVTVIALTTRLTTGGPQSPNCVADELALRLLLNEARAALESFDLLSDGVSAALDTFAGNVFEDMDHEWLYDDGVDVDGLDGSPVSEALRVAPMRFEAWFTPFGRGRFIHPYAADEPESAVR